MKKIITTFILALGIGALSASAAVVIGAGSGIPTNNFDTPGGDRLNVERTQEFLPAATYSVLDWAMNVHDHTQGIGGAGTITPILLGERDNPFNSTYTVLWLGDAFDPTSNGDQVVASYAPGVETFSVSDPLTAVYAAFFTEDNGSALIRLQNGSGNSDHDANGFTPPTGPGDSVDGISHLNLGREYAFGINVEAFTAVARIPEPSSVALWLTGMAVLQAARRRKSNIDD